MKKIIVVAIGLLMLLSSSVFAEELTKRQIANRKLVKYYARFYGTDEQFCDAIAKIESNWGLDPKAYNNPKGPASKNEVYISRGVMQLTIETGRSFNKKQIKTVEDLYRDEANIIAGVRFIKYLFKTYPSATLVEIAQMYNLGETKYSKGIRNSEYTSRFLKAYWWVAEHQ